MKITKKDEKKIVEYVTHWLEVLNMSEWEVIVSVDSGDKEENKGCLARVAPSPQYTSAKMVVYPEYFKLNEEQKSKTICHEMVHCLLEETWVTIMDLKNGWNISDKHLEEKNEYLTTRITNILTKE